MNKLRKFSIDELNIILDRHKKWLNSESEGLVANLSSADLSSADLSYANLSYADLSYADLSYADLSYAKLITFQFNRHFSFCTFNGRLTIGCKTMDLDKWLEKYNGIGLKEGYEEREILAYGNFIKLCKSLQEEHGRA